MKTFSEFLDEALASFIVKAAARQLFKSKALQKGLSKTLSQVPKQISKPPKITGFQTGRGSKYTYTQKPNSWPQTQRTAPNDPYHPTPAGTKQKSDYTMFTTPAQIYKERKLAYMLNKDLPPPEYKSSAT